MFDLMHILIFRSDIEFVQISILWLDRLWLWTDWYPRWTSVLEKCDLASSPRDKDSCERSRALFILLSLFLRGYVYTRLCYGRYYITSVGNPRDLLIQNAKFVHEKPSRKWDFRSNSWLDLGSQTAEKKLFLNDLKNQIRSKILAYTA